MEISIEQVKAQYLNDDFIEAQQEILRRVYFKGKRYYFRELEDGQISFFKSVTTIIDDNLAKDKYLLDWIIDSGKDYYHAMILLADKGTLMHIFFEKLLINRFYDLDKIKEDIEIIKKENNLMIEDDLTEFIQKALLGLSVFIKDYNVRPIAIEMCLYHPKGFAGAIDLVCKMTDPKTGEDFTAIIDFKSGINNYENHIIQLQAYYEMWNYHYPQYPVDKIYNYHYKDFKKLYTKTGLPYSLIDQTDKKERDKWDLILKLDSFKKQDFIFKSYSGIIDLDNNDDFSDLVKENDLHNISKEEKEDVEDKKTA